MAISWQLLTAGGAVGRAGSRTIHARRVQHDLDAAEQARDAYELGRKELEKRQTKRQVSRERLDLLETLGIYGKGAVKLAKLPQKHWDQEIEQLIILSSEMPKTVTNPLATLQMGTLFTGAKDQAEVPLTYQERMQRFGFQGEFIDPTELPDDWKEAAVDRMMGQLPPQVITTEDESDIRTSLTDRLFGPTMADPVEAQQKAADRLGISLHEYQTMLGDTYLRPSVEGVTYARMKTKAEGLVEGTAEIQYHTARLTLQTREFEVGQIENKQRPATIEERTVPRLMFNTDTGDYELQDVQIGYPDMPIWELKELLTLENAAATRAVNQAQALSLIDTLGKIPRQASSVIRQYAAGITANLFKQQITVGPQGNMLSDQPISPLAFDLQTNFVAAAQQSWVAQGKEADQSITYARTRFPLIQMMSAVAYAEQVGIPIQNEHLIDTGNPPITLSMVLDHASQSTPDEAWFEQLLAGTEGLHKSLAPLLIEYYSLSDAERRDKDEEYRILVGDHIADSLMSHRLTAPVPFTDRAPELTGRSHLDPVSEANLAYMHIMDLRSEDEGFIANPEERIAAANAAKKAILDRADASRALEVAPGPPGTGVDGSLDILTSLTKAIDVKNERGDTVFTNPELTRIQQITELVARFTNPDSPHSIKDTDILAGVEDIFEALSRAPSNTNLTRNELEAAFKTFAFQVANTRSEPAPAPAPAPAAAPAPAPVPAPVPAPAAAPEPAPEPAPVPEPAPAAEPVPHVESSLMAPPARYNPLLMSEDGVPLLYADEPPPGYQGDFDEWVEDNIKWNAGGKPRSGMALRDQSNYRQWEAAKEAQAAFEIAFHEAQNQFPESRWQGNPLLDVLQDMIDRQVSTKKRVVSIINLQFVRPLLRRLSQEDKIDVYLDSHASNKLADILYQTYVTESKEPAG